jgi:AcrR family transcriptional regulator
MAPKPDVSEERKDQILEAATRVFTQRGFDDARMDDIVAESGLSKGAIYWYFDSKEAIIVAILDRIFDWETAHIQKNISSDLGAAKQLELFVQASIEEMHKIEPLMPLFFDFWTRSLRNPTINQAIKRYYQLFLEIIEPIIQQGISTGEFRPVDVKQSAMTIGAALEGTILMWAYFPKIIDFDKQFRITLDILLQGLVANELTSVRD